MKILLHSVSPFCQSGYASVTREIVRRLIDLGHSVVIGTKHRQYGSFSWGGAEVVDGTNLTMMVEYSKQFDLVFTFWDVWRMEMRFPREKWVAYTPISSQTISDMTIEVLKDAQTVVAMTKHGETEMRNAGLEPFYAPHGVDMGKFRIKPEGRAEFRKKLGISATNNFSWGNAVISSSVLPVTIFLIITLPSLITYLDSIQVFGSGSISEFIKR